MPAGLHIVRHLRPGKPALWYVYAWRGGPCIARVEGARPRVTADLTDAAARERAKRAMGGSGDTIAALVTSYKGSPEWTKLAASTRSGWMTWLERIREEFGTATIRMFGEREMRGEVLDWRDRWAAQPRSADLAIQVFSRLLSWAVDRGKLPVNILLGVASLYEADRSDIIWEERHFDAIAPHASAEVQDAIDLAACTGLRRGDLVKLPWSAIGTHAIVWRTGKSRGRNLVTIPLLPETETILARIKRRHAEEMSARRPDRRKPLTDTVLASSYWRPWTPKGLGSRFNDAKQASGVDVNFHDLRGTFATRCMIAGLTDTEIADILGWSPKDVHAIRVKYVDQARVVIAIGERIAAASVKRL